MPRTTFAVIIALLVVIVVGQVLLLTSPTRAPRFVQLTAAVGGGRVLVAAGEIIGVFPYQRQGQPCSILYLRGKQQAVLVAGSPELVQDAMVRGRRR